MAPVTSTPPPAEPDGPAVAETGGESPRPEGGNPVHYKLLEYDTGNIGDEIQSLAARQFLPRVDGYANRDHLGTLTRGWSTPTKMILNGWWLHGTDWPPDSEFLDPLLISMFFDKRTAAVREAVLAPGSRGFLTEHGPVGARDLATLDFLQNNNIPAYFSGCLTLTLRRDPAASREDYVLAVDVPDEVLTAMRARTQRRVVAISVDHDDEMSRDLRFRLAELYLLFYQSASCVVTTRLHALLPSLALETPVLHVRKAGVFDPQRLSGLSDLAHSVTTEEYLEGDVSFDLDVPPPNSGRHLELREALTQKALAFCGTSAPVPPAVAGLLRDPSSLAVVAELVGDQVERGFRGRLVQRRLDEPPRDRLHRTLRTWRQASRATARRLLRG
ncbi:polysaccharide pyruvyl transferase family protein [Ornithinimicrobium panacihumi]|uniref:polysaccharide pyruvyl transferase family protein n=1 Tax=Ornithinimicrobium panacihumi TaxID=2008449 RepID=UPI003F8B1090